MSGEAKDPDNAEQPVIGNTLRIPDGASALRFMVGAAQDTGYIFFKTLEEARTHPNAALIMEDVMRLWRTTRHENKVHLAASRRRVSLCYKHRWKAIA